MAFTKLYIGEREDLELYLGDDVIDFLFEVFNSDDTDYDFTGLTDLYLEIYDGRGGTLLLTITDDSGATNVAQSSNDITLNIDWSASMDAIGLGDYYYRLAWEDSSNHPITVAYGTWRVGLG